MEMGQELANYYEDNYVETVKKMAESTESNTLIKQLLDIVSHFKHPYRIL